MCRIRIIATILFIFFANTYGKTENFKICVVGNPKVKTTHTTKYCDLLEKSKKTIVSCLYKTDRLGCLSAVSVREADFSLFDPEDLYYSTLSKENLILVASEIRDLQSAPFQYRYVVVIRKSSNITGIKDLAGKKLCHPGLESGPDWSHLFAQYFEERVAPSNCEEGLSLYEDRIKTTSDFFGYACKAGPWVANLQDDARLKQDYSNLCALCDNTDCRAGEKYRGTGGSITCFKDKVGDVLWARYKEAKNLLQSSSGEVSDYAFLCDDGSLVEFTSENPCVWLAKPWKVVGANRKSATNVQKIVQNLKDKPSEWEENLLHVLELYVQYFQNLNELRTPEDYLRTIPGYLSASAMSEDNCKPKHSIKLCLSSSAELDKCTRMSKAALALGIQPSVECVQKMNITSCMNSVAETESDVVVVPPDFLYDATLKYNLKTFLLETGNQLNNSYLVSAFVKKNSNLKELTDLKNKKVCFSRRDGIGWYSAVATLRQQKFIDSECRDHEGLSEFFSEICVMSKDDSNDKDSTDLPVCCSGTGDGVNIEANTFRCLQKDGCDVAFLDFNYFKRNAGKKKSGFSNDDFKVLCADNNAIGCHWSWANPSYLMSSSQMASPKAAEAYDVFFRLGQVFGRNSLKNNAMFKLFGPFNEASDILFRDSSTSFVASERHNNRNNYMEIVNNLHLCSGCSQIFTSSLPLFILLTFILIFFN